MSKGQGDDLGLGVKRAELVLLLQVSMQSWADGCLSFPIREMDANKISLFLRVPMTEN